ncbi:MAG TPA: response regulator transcription factor [Tepidisphaeraceae bacterium]|jgi:DNA-binding NarL/FixJ family response regulator|nr:response regulator transcription factor [Tepidisphaeraceae bacterium]
MSPIRILLADDHQLVREGFHVLVNSENGMTIVGEAHNGRRAVELSLELMPDIIVMDVAMPELNGIDATRRILAESPKCKIVAVSANSDRRLVSEMLKAGAKAYLLKDSAFEELALAIRTVAAGRVFLSSRIADGVVAGFLQGDEAGKPPSAFTILTSREREVLQLMAEGLATKQIAAALDVSVKTVETHRRQVMEKVNLHSVAELTKYAIREGLASLEVITSTQ